ncbi:mitotic checkpoint regulator, MAD2B-interacting-domain-containing protein [Plectosphaerella cucumerina]|uniref:Mitotic checkpoint regulator, MAD2B-interacting-domain-containing protein n=1 Tax=Plectosphaerella cucumerina TaxID=40658 RepID=A0A8K0X0T1_9PEZI|nr:mitotic checkpoint regulator, MAD2B-interacting-domain-containing protein [Plectosphaerella cucumerina]
MGLVDYSDSESDSEVAPKPVPKPTPATATGKKPFQKVVDRSNPGKIRVNLPQIQPEDKPADSDGPPAKRAKIGAGGGGRFSGMNSFLPPPKNAAGTKPKPTGGARPAFQLKTSAEAGFSRDSGLFGGDSDSGFELPAPTSQPSIPDTMKPADEVKLVGKPMMFRPLSVARNNKKKPVKKTPAAPAPTQAPPSAQDSTAAPSSETPAAPAPPKKISLFSIASEPDADTDPTPASSTVYEPLFETEPTTASYDGYADTSSWASQPVPSTGATATSLDTIADEMNLSAAARRELFGRGGMPGHTGADSSAARVISFDTDAEYRHNETIRAAGEQQVHNPLRAIAPGKHNLRKLVSAVQGQREALEESFAQAKSNKREASGRYGW